MSCTCHLEMSFGACPPISDNHPTYQVIDAECVTVATCPTEAYAELVAAALNAYADVNPCIKHRENPHYPHAPDYECSECKK